MYLFVKTPATTVFKLSFLLTPEIKKKRATNN